VRFLDSPWAITQSSPIHPEHFVDEAREVARKEMPYLCTQGDCRASRTVTVKDAKGNKGTLSCSVTVYQSISSMCDCTRITPTQGVAISPVTLTAGGGAGGPYTFSATGLPAGLTLSSSGVLSGTPTVNGTFSYVITITDKAGDTDTLQCSMTVKPAPITSTCVTVNAVKGMAITPVTLSASGGAGGPYTFSATGLPPGLSISSSGTISGTPTSTGTFSYTVTITDSKGNQGTVCCSITVYPSISSSCSCVTISATHGVAITPVTVTASGGAGGPYTFTATGLPAGLSISTGGTISGTPTTAGIYFVHDYDHGQERE